MPFIGNQPALSYTSFAKQDFTTSATTSYTLNNPVANENEIALFINFVRQEPTTAYTASGTTLTLTSATSASDDMYCVFLGKAVQTVNPPNASVGTSQLADNGVTTAKIANDAITKDKTSNLMYPAFQAYLSSNQSVTSNTLTKVQIDTEVFDTDGYFDNSTNYRFTPLVAGKYFVHGSVFGDPGNTADLSFVAVYLYKNGSENMNQKLDFRSNEGRDANLNFSTIIDMNGLTDYIELYGLVRALDGSGTLFGGTGKRTYFGAYRIGD
jgi:hypothetical protein